MNRYTLLKQIIENYIDDHGFNVEIESNIKDTSYDKTNDTYLCEFGENFKVIDMDVIAKDVYGNIYKSGKTRSTADAFFVLEDGKWYFVEFKNTKIDTSSLKLRVQLKAYENLHLLFDILLDMTEISRELGCIENPIDFIRKSQLTKKQYVPGFMEELNSSVFKESYLLTEKNFYREFIAE